MINDELPHRPGTRAVLVLITGALLACNGPVVGPELTQPELAMLEADVVTTASGPALTVRAVPSDALVIGEHQRVEVQLTTTNGEFERLLLGPQFCARDSKTVRCQEFVVVMDQGHDVREIESRVRAVPAALLAHTVCANGDCNEITGFGTVKLFGAELEDSMALAAGWPGVQFTDYSSVGDRQPADLGESVENAFDGGGLLLFADPARDDDRLQVRSGDSLSIRYEQPDGHVLTAVTTF